MERHEFMSILALQLMRYVDDNSNEEILSPKSSQDHTWMGEHRMDDILNVKKNSDVLYVNWNGT